MMFALELLGVSTRSGVEATRGSNHWASGPRIMLAMDPLHYVAMGVAGGIGAGT